VFSAALEFGKEKETVKYSSHDPVCVPCHIFSLVCFLLVLRATFELSNWTTKKFIISTKEII